jgi:hypothetical protein
MKSHHRSLTRLCAFGAVFLSSAVASAQLIPNGSFEDTPAPGLGVSWSGVGDAGSVDSPFSVWPASHGDQFAVMTNAPTPAGGIGDPVPGLPVFAPSVLPPDLETGLGMPAGSLAAFAGLPIAEGSGILSATFVMQPFHTALLFDFQFVTNEPPPGFLPFPDAAFASIDGSPPLYFYAADGPVVPSGSPLYFIRDTGGYGTLAAGLPPGPHTIAFGIVDVGDGDVSSGLFIDNVRLEPAIPEPSSLVLVAISLAGAAVFGRRTLRSGR